MGQASADSSTAVIRQIYNEALTEQYTYQWLKRLTAMGPRFAGSEQATESVLWLKELCDSLGFETALQKVKVPHWVRGPEQAAFYRLKGSKKELRFTALGGSVPTNGWLEAPVVEVPNFEALDSLDLEGKIAFFNIPMDPTFINTGFAYGQAVKQRWVGAVEASRRGAVGVVIRSLSSSINDYPHTGSMTYQDAPKKIPAGAISTLGAEQLSRVLAENPDLKLSFRINSEWRDSSYSYNLIADLRQNNRNEFILISGHIDSWELGTGAHDDGAGSMHALASAFLLKKLAVPVESNLRVVFFMNEEFGLTGAKTYAQKVDSAGVKHIVAIESDGGGFSPRGLSTVAPTEIQEEIRSFRKFLEPYGIHRFSSRGSGADISQLKDPKVIRIGLRPDSHRYFEVHHSERDVIEEVNTRELEMGSATLAALIYLLDKNRVIWE